MKILHPFVCLMVCTLNCTVSQINFSKKDHSILVETSLLLEVSSTAQLIDLTWLAWLSDIEAKQLKVNYLINYKVGKFEINFK